MQALFRAAGIAASIAVLGACSRQDDPAARPAAPSAPAAVIAPITATTEVKPFTIGVFQAAAVSDGSISFPNDNKTLAVNMKKAEVDALLASSGLPTDSLHLAVQ